MKKVLFVLLAATLAVMLSSCFLIPAMLNSTSEVTSEDVDDEPIQDDYVSEAEEEPAGVQEGSGTLGDYVVEIKDGFTAQDYDGNDAVVINFTFTNNSDEAQSFMTSLIVTAFQDGVQLESAFLIDVDGYDIDNASKEIKPGVSLDVQQAFATTSDSPIEVEVTEFLGFDDSMVTQTFTF